MLLQDYELRNNRRMVSTKEKYYIRALLLITGLVLLCVGGAFFIYALLLGKTPNEGTFIFDLRGRIIMWTLVVIGFICLLVVFKLSDYSRKIEDEEGGIKLYPTNITLNVVLRSCLVFSRLLCFPSNAAIAELLGNCTIYIHCVLFGQALSLPKERLPRHKHILDLG